MQGVCSPQQIVGNPATRWPDFQRWVTDFPTSTISPANSWPMTLPGARGIAELGSVICKSEPQIPQFFTFRMRSCGPQTGSGTVSITSGFDISLNTAARTVPLPISLWTGLGGGYVIRGNEETGPPMNPYATAHEMLSELEARRVSARELLQFEIARNEKLANTLNAVIATDIPRALKDADAIDAA